MQRRRRFVLSGAALVPAVMLVVVYALGFRMAPEPLIGDPESFAAQAWFSTPLVQGGATVVVLTVLIFVALRGLDSRVSSVTVFVLGWAAMVFATVAGQVIRSLATGGDSRWSAFSATQEKLFTSLIWPPGQTATSSLLLGWLVGAALLLAYRLTRPRPGTESSP